ncbi:MAG: RNA polymerase sigma factor [Mycobacteriales bacterium]
MDEGQRADIRDLYAGCHHRLVGQLAVIIGDVAEAEEALAEAFVRGLTRPARLLAMDSPEGWLRTVALNVARRRYRRARLASTLLPRAGTGTPGDELDAALDRIALYQTLRRLPFEQREALVLHDVAGLSVAEIAAMRRVPEGTVKARLSRGRAAVAVTAVVEG